jgi:hypothetical protein
MIFERTRLGPRSFRIAGRVGDLVQDTEQRNPVDLVNARVEETVDHKQTEFARHAEDGREQMSFVAGQPF